MHLIDQSGEQGSSACEQYRIQLVKLSVSKKFIGQT